MKIRKLTSIAIFTSLTVVLSQIAIPIPYTPIPFTFSIIAVFLAGAVLDKWSAAISQLVYLALGAIGIPVFANFRGGVSALISVTGGFLFSYVLMAFIIAFTIELFKKKTYLSLAIGMIIALAVCYLLGGVWFAFLREIPLQKAFTITTLPFIPFDLAKIVITSAIAVALKRPLKQLNM